MEFLLPGPTIAKKFCAPSASEFIIFILNIRRYKFDTDLGPLKIFHICNLYADGIYSYLSSFRFIRFKYLLILHHKILAINECLQNNIELARM